VTRIVVDASVAVKWFVPEELSADARKLLAPEYELLAPDLLWAELGSALWKKHRRQELDRRTAWRLFRDFAQVPIQLHPTDRWTEAALQVAFDHDITVYDALYLVLAAGNACRFVTADRRLHEACQGSGIAGLVEWVAVMR
jgi:predicted nucleic acid-binding protein